MISSVLLVCLLAAPELFDVSTLPTDGEGRQVFLAAIDDNRTADVVVQNGRDLHIRLDNGEERTFAIPQGVTAYDIYDINGDGRSEVIAIHGREVLALDSLLDSKGQSLGKVLFEADSLYAMETPEPYRQVLVKGYQEQLVILVPQPESLIAYSLDGSAFGEFPNLPEVSQYVAEFTSRTWFRSDRATPSMNLTTISEKSELIPDLPPELQPPDVPNSFTLGKQVDPNSRPSMSEHFEFDNGDYSGRWDGVIVSEDTNRIQFAMLRNDDNGNTLVFMREVPLTPEGEDWANAKNGPVRRYPGRLVSQLRWTADETLGQRPDFDGDGFMDLILWDAPKPGMSVESIMRTVVSRSWPLRLTMHLYSPEKQRFEPRPAYAIKYKVPITWFLESGPFRNFSLADFDGDGKTDVAMSTDEKEYQVWLAASGFSRDPDWTHTFPEPIQETLQTADLSGNGRNSILLRGEKNLYLLQAR